MNTCNVAKKSYIEQYPAIRALGESRDTTIGEGLLEPSQITITTHRKKDMVIELNDQIYFQCSRNISEARAEVYLKFALR